MFFPLEGLLTVRAWAVAFVGATMICEISGFEEGHLTAIMAAGI